MGYYTVCQPGTVRAATLSHTALRRLGQIFKIVEDSWPEPYRRARVAMPHRLTRRSRSYNPSASARLHAPDADRSLLRGRPPPFNFPGGPLGTGAPFLYQRSPAQARPFGPASATRGGVLPKGATIGPARSRGQHTADQGPEGAALFEPAGSRPWGDAADLRALAWATGRSMAGRPQCLWLTTTERRAILPKYSRASA